MTNSELFKNKLEQIDHEATLHEHIINGLVEFYKAYAKECIGNNQVVNAFNDIKQLMISEDNFGKFLDAAYWVNNVLWLNYPAARSLLHEPVKECYVYERFFSRVFPIALDGTV